MIIVLLWAMLAVPCAAERHALRATLDAAAFWSQKGDDLSTKRDANDHLRDGSLGPLLAAMLQQATPQSAAEGLHWDLFDAGLVSA